MYAHGSTATATATANTGGAGDAYDMPDGFLGASMAGGAGDAGDAYDMPGGFEGGEQGFQLDANMAGGAYDMPDGLGLTFVDGNATSHSGENDDAYEIPIAVLQAMSSTNASPSPAQASETTPASAQRLQSDGKSRDQKFKRKPSIYNGFGDDAASAGTGTASTPATAMANGYAAVGGTR